MAQRLATAALPITSAAKSSLQPLARLGYAAKGVVYVIVGYVAARAAFAAGSPTGTGGALRELLRGGGKWMVYAVAVGLAAHVVWRLVQALRDPEHHDGKIARRFFYFLSALIYSSLALTALRLAQGRPDGGGGGDGDGQRQLVAGLLDAPFGNVLVAVAGLGIAGYALQQAWLALRGDVAKRLNLADADHHRVVVAIGRIGTAARAVVLGIIATFFVEAARRHDPGAAGGTEEVLRSFGSGWLLATVAVGLGLYGVFQFANAGYRRIPTWR